MMKPYPIASEWQQTHQLLPLPSIVLPTDVSALLHEIVRASAPLPDARTRDAISDWVVPSGDGWAPCPLPDDDTGNWLPDTRLCRAPCCAANDMQHAEQDDMLAVVNLLRLCADTLEQELDI